MKKKLLLFSILCMGLGAQAQWLNQNPNIGTDYGIYDLSIADASTVWAAVYDPFTPSITNQFTKTTNGGTSWATGILPAGFFFIDIDAKSSTVAYAATFASPGGGGAIHHTSNGGTSWNDISTPGMFVNPSVPRIINFFDATNGVAIGDSAASATSYFEVWTTADAGATWSAVPSTNIPVRQTVERVISKEYCAIGSTIWFATNKGRVFKSTDMGVNWTVSSVAASLNNISFKDALNGLANSGTTLYSTIDGGTTWLPVSFAGPLFIFDLANMPGTNSYVSVGNAFGVGSSKSDDGGLTWTELDNAIYRLRVSFFDANTGWCGGVNEDAPNLGMAKWSPPVSDDIGVYSLIVPPTGCASSTQLDIKFVVKNFGTNVISNFKIAYKRDDGSPVVTSAVINHTIQPGATDTNSLGDINFVSRYANFKAWATLPNGNADNLAGNDTTYRVIDVYVQETASVPYTESFDVPLNNNWCKLYPPAPGGGQIDTNTTGNACATNESLVFLSVGLSKLDLKVNLAPVADTKRIIKFIYGDAEKTEAMETADDGLYLSGNGVDFVKISEFDFSGQNTCFNINMNLDSAALANSITLTDQSIIRWQYDGTFFTNFDSYFMDDLSITSEIIVGIKENLRYSFFVEQNQPNPGQAYTKINYAVRNAVTVNLYIYNLLGERVYATVQNATAGNNSMDIDLHKFESGTYFYTLKNGIESITKKMSVIK